MAKPKAVEPELQTIMDQIAALPSLDLIFTRANPFKQAKKGPERRALIEHMRLERARWEFKRDKAEAKKEAKSDD